jgi:hypothetical protein
LLNKSLANPGGDEKSGNTASQAVELVGILFSICGFLGVGKIIGTGCKRRGDVIVESTGLVESENEKSFLPLRART